jgi:prepilin-type N-terminal cleavage/methylation domain-containing protein
MTAIKKGFTLIELLIVIAILGVLAVVILVAINPQEQLARTRDAGRTSSVTQLGHAMQAYATAHNGTYIDESDTWIDDLVTAGEIATVPGGQNYAITTYGTGCTTNDQDGENSYCYDADSPSDPSEGVIVFSQLESGSNNTRCPNTPTDTAFVVFDSILSRGGIVCVDQSGGAADPTYDVAGQNFIN